MSISNIASQRMGVLLFAIGTSLAWAGPGEIALAADVTAPHNQSGVIGKLGIGQEATGQLQGRGDEGVAAYHTYTVEVPAGVSEIVIEMVADGDLDLGIKHGSPIEAYGTGADWDRGDDSVANTATLSVKNPQAGTWYIDVILGLQTTDSYSYTLQVK